MKKTVIIAVCVCMVLALVSCTQTEPPAASQEESVAATTEDAPQEEASQEAASTGTMKVGVTFGDLSNPVWADCANYMMEAGGEYGLDVSVLGCNTSQEQITQIENFITSGCNAIVIGAKDAASLDDVTQKAMDAGIVVYALGYPITNFTAEMMVDNYTVGYDAASMAADWINANFQDEEVEVAINDYPDIDVLVTRVQGMTDALAEQAPNAKVVATVSGTTTEEVMPKAENAFTANPNIKVCVAIGDGGALGFKEAAKGMGLTADDFGIFEVDCTETVANAIYNDDLIRGAVSLGGGKLHATTIMTTLQQIFEGKDYEKSTPYPEQPVTKDNVQEVAEKLGYALS